MIKRNSGFTLVELIIIILLIGVIASVAIRSLSGRVDSALYEHTKKEMDQLALAISGDPHVHKKGIRSDFGYIGDVGAIPPNINALYQNPGGYASWNGPYVSNSSEDDNFAYDAWESAYLISGTNIQSSGSGSLIEKSFGNSTNALLSNSLSGYIIDASGQAPGLIYNDSLVVSLTIPNGSGSYSTLNTTPDKNGNFSFSSLPIGVHQLQVIYNPDSDTVSYKIAVEPESNGKMSIVFPADLF